MNDNVQEICGSWDLGYSLDQQTLSSTPIGKNAYGHMQFDTIRPPVGEALFQLKYRNDYSQIQVIVRQMVTSLAGRFQDIHAVIPMPPSKQRAHQPVAEIAQGFAQLIRVPYHDNLLVKAVKTQAMKDIASREEKIAALLNAFRINDILVGGPHNILMVDDLYDTGSSLEAATQALRTYPKIGQVYVAAVTRRR
jgi:predicted amidophosphoribosyltransferase